MKKLAVIAVSLFSLASTCGREDTVGPDRWRRTFEPRLVETTEYAPCGPPELQPDQVVPKRVCGEPPPEVKADACADVVSSREEAAQLLVTKPQCLDRAIVELDRFSVTDPTDLAAAYYVRAQRDDRPTDFLLALEAAEQGIVSGNPAALFNYALVQEALGFTEPAIAAWDRYLAKDSSSQWAVEAKSRRNVLIASRGLDARRSWDEHRKALPSALQKGDRAAIAHLIDPFPRSAWTYFEEEVLGRWAAEPTPAHVNEARLFAEELSRRTQDRFALDIVASLSPQVREAHRLHSEGIRAKRAHDIKSTAFKNAVPLFQRAGSPMLLSTKINLVDPDVDGTNHYPHLYAEARAMRGFARYLVNDYLGALSDYESALLEAKHLHDPELEFALYSSTLGMYRILGQYDRAAVETFRSHDFATVLPDPERRNRYMGEAAALASSLGFPRVARLYQSTNVSDLRAALASETREDAARRVRHNLVIALRSRAAIYAELGQYPLAERDLAEIQKTVPAEMLGALRARIEESAAHTPNLDVAVAHLNNAIQLAGNEYSTFFANLFVQRAAVLRKLNRLTEAEKDLQRALELVRVEEDTILEKAQKGDPDQISWTQYFSRFDETYDSLVAMMAGRPEQAFDVAEQARAYEPLKRLLESGTVAKAFRRELGSRHFLSLPQIQKHLPGGTVVIAYAVTAEKTYAWVVTHDRVQPLELNATANNVTRWSQDVANAVGDESVFQDHLVPPYDPLIAEPLQKARELVPGLPRIVIIPDDAMHGLPFSALRDPASRQYLGQQAIISIAPSATFYIHSLLRDRELLHSGEPSVALFGNPEFDSNLYKLKPLRDAEREVLEISTLYEHATPHIGAAATMTEFLRSVPQAEIVQVAAHGIVNPRAPSHSALLLAKDAQYSGLLDARTLLERLHAEKTRLMVLSACSSAGGLPVGSEGVAPLVRPILAAGVPGVVGTLWDVDDATSADLMVSFHRHYRQGDDAALALHKAQVEMMTRKQGAVPAVNWAPFQVIGYASSPFAAPENERGKPP
ncbi:MAG TPA: CHAT domain-containing tetratricopeptide repeat protein [Thermoanaerobaculia bacterium]